VHGEKQSKNISRQEGETQGQKGRRRSTTRKTNSKKKGLKGTDPSRTAYSKKGDKMREVSRESRKRKKRGNKTSPTGG